MWFDIAIFAVAVLGLCALFIGKALEQKGAAVAPLARLRRADALVLNGLRGLYEDVPRRLLSLLKSGCVLCRDGAHIAGFAVHARLHRFSARFGEYLRKHGSENARNRGHASFYLKSMLEHKKSIERADA